MACRARRCAVEGCRSEKASSSRPLYNKFRTHTLAFVHDKTARASDPAPTPKFLSSQTRRRGRGKNILSEIPDGLGLSAPTSPRRSVRPRGPPATITQSTTAVMTTGREEASLRCCRSHVWRERWKRPMLSASPTHRRPTLPWGRSPVRSPPLSPRSRPWLSRAGSRPPVGSGCPSRSRAGSG